MLKLKRREPVQSAKVVGSLWSVPENGHFQSSSFHQYRVLSKGVGKRQNGLIAINLSPQAQRTVSGLREVVYFPKQDDAAKFALAKEKTADGAGGYRHPGSIGSMGEVDQADGEGSCRVIHHIQAHFDIDSLRSKVLSKIRKKWRFARKPGKAEAKLRTLIHRIRAAKSGGRNAANAVCNFFDLSKKESVFIHAQRSESQVQKLKRFEDGLVNAGVNGSLIKKYARWRHHLIQNALDRAKQDGVDRVRLILKDNVGKENGAIFQEIVARHPDFELEAPYVRGESTYLVAVRTR